MYGQNRCCNVRAESQQIVRQAYSRAYNTPLRDKVVYNVSIFPDGRVVMQEVGPVPARRRGPALHLYGSGRLLAYWYSRVARLGKVSIVAVQHGF